jgi:iron only hydrogenase large subunit-like protein
MSVFINNVDDFINPSLACVNPLVLGSSKAEVTAGKVQLQTDYSISEFSGYGTGKVDLIKAKASEDSSKKVATVSLSDCLACRFDCIICVLCFSFCCNASFPISSGCVTSAESVLIQEQSYTKLLEALEDEYKIVVVCLSPQSVASLAAHCEQFSCAEMFLRLAAVFKSIGVQLVIDADSANDVSLIESRNEFLERYTRGKVKQAWVQPAHSSTALTSTRLNVLAGNSSSSVGTEVDVGDVLDESQDHLQLPMLISACPGWVCFAEKTQPQVLNFVSATKSAQQILGCLLKKVFFNDITGYDAQHCASSSSSGSNVVRKELYTVSVQPCFDKKLEGSRKVRYHCLSLLRLIFIVISILFLPQDFYHDDIQQQEIDLVLSTTEIWNLLEHLASMPPSSHESRKKLKTCCSEGLESNCADDEICCQRADAVGPFEYLLAFSPDRPGGSNRVEHLLRNFSDDGQHLLRSTVEYTESGGFADYIMRSASKQLWALDLGSNPAKYTFGRTTDYAATEVQDPTNTSSTLLRFGRAYGMSNIQSITNKMKRGIMPLDLVEVMACPSGCLNGGGQIKTVATETKPQTEARLAAVRAKYSQSTDINDSRYFRPPEQSPLVQFLYGDDLFHISPQYRGHVRTRYHAIPKLETVAPLAAAAKW